jgi:hypothetical protein
VAPLRVVVLGLVMVVIDLRFNGFDFVPDPAGWVIVAMALAALTQRDGLFGLAAAAAALSCLLSLPDLVNPTTDTGLGLAQAVALEAVIFATCTGVMAVLPGRARIGNLIRWSSLIVAILVTGIGLAFGDENGGEPALAVVGVPLILVGVGIYIWFLVFLWQSSTDEPVQSSGSSAS